MYDLPIGSLWRSRRDAANMRIIVSISPARGYGDNVQFIEYYSPVHGRSMITVSSPSEWLSHFQLLDA